MNLNFEASYFIKNNICIGITFPVTPSVNGLYMIGLVNTVGFFTRYYFGQRSHPLNYENNNRFAFFAEGIIIGGYSSANNQSSSLNVLSNTTSQGSNNLKDYILQGKASAACTYLLFKHIAIDAFGSYYFEYYWSSAESSASTIIDKNISIYNGLGFVLQVDIYL
ncbi:MAG: hypothetical protein HKL88_08040 [Bacteroidia bacterium]|jgi:hypothetical protein|nr:hypothetical protein [Bacteroidia bacterium]